MLLLSLEVQSRSSNRRARDAGSAGADSTRGIVRGGEPEPPRAPAVPLGGSRGRAASAHAARPPCWLVGPWAPTQVGGPPAGYPSRMV